MPRLKDQLIIMNSISEVREELAAAHKAGEPSIVTIPIATRLATLYSVLDLDVITEAIENADTSYPKAA